MFFPSLLHIRSNNFLPRPNRALLPPSSCQTWTERRAAWWRRWCTTRGRNRWGCLRPKSRRSRTFLKSEFAQWLVRRDRFIDLSTVSSTSGYFRSNQTTKSAFKTSLWRLFTLSKGYSSTVIRGAVFSCFIISFPLFYAFFKVWGQQQLQMWFLSKDRLKASCSVSAGSCPNTQRWISLKPNSAETLWNPHGDSCASYRNRNIRNHLLFSSLLSVTRVKWITGTFAEVDEWTALVLPSACCLNI